MTWSAFKQHFVEVFAGQYNADEAAAIFSALMADKYHVQKTHYLMHIHETVPLQISDGVEDDIKLLKANVPLQHITERAHFFGLELKVNQHVLIPRPETEELVDLVIKTFKGTETPNTILDLCSGSGCIALALKYYFKNAKVEGYEWSDEAIEISKENAENLNLPVRFVKRNVLDLPEEESFWDCMVSNPPYISRAEADQMEKHVLDHEPEMALFPKGDDPLIFYRAIADYASKTLHKGGYVFAEVNQYMPEATKSIFEEKGFLVEVFSDINENPRMLRAQKNHA